MKHCWHVQSTNLYFHTVLRIPFHAEVWLLWQKKWKIKKNILTFNHQIQSCQNWCEVLASGPLPSLFKWCPWGYYWHWPEGHVWNRNLSENILNSFCMKPQDKSSQFLHKTFNPRDILDPPWGSDALHRLNYLEKLCSKSSCWMLRISFYDWPLFVICCHLYIINFSLLADSWT